jgi:hypothetical protein
MKGRLKTNKMKTVHVQIMAFDKNSNDNIGRYIVANTKKSFNKQISEFEEEVPYTKFYIEIIADEVLDEEQEKIVEDHEVN